MMAILQTHHNKLWLWTGAKIATDNELLFPHCEHRCFHQRWASQAFITHGEVEPPLTVFFFFIYFELPCVKATDWIARRSRAQ